MSVRTIDQTGAAFYLTTLVSDHASLAGDTPCAALARDTATLAPLGSLTLSSAANHGTSIVAKGRYAYLATDSSIPSDPDFFVIDVSNPAHPTVIAWLNTGPGIAALALDGDHVYAANTSRTSQLQVISVRDPLHPALVSVLKIPNVFGTGAQGVGNAIAAHNGMVFLGLTKTGSGPELSIINIDDSLHPHSAGSWPAGAKINAIAVRGTRVFIASPGATPLRVLDSTNTALPSLIAALALPDASSTNGQAIALAGSRAYIGRNSSAVAPADAKQFFIASTKEPPLTHEYSSLALRASVYAITAHTGRLLLATNDPARSLQLWNAMDGSAPALLSFAALSAPARGIACGSTDIYVATDSHRALSILTLTP